MLFLIILVGTIGFVFIADYGWINALYMTVITISTVGFKEVEPLDSDAKIFTILLIITSITIFGYIVSVITDYIANNKFIEELNVCIDCPDKDIECHDCGWTDVETALENLKRLRMD